MKKILIVTSGASQFLYQMAALNKLYDFRNLKVSLIYNGVYRESINVFFVQICEFLKINYLGQFYFDIIPIPIESKLATIYGILSMNPKMDRAISEKYPILKSQKCIDVLIIPVRVKMPADISLLHFLRPKRIVFVIDGVIGEIPKRDFSKKKYKYLRSSLKELPMKKDIYSPSFLEKDCSRIGRYKEIDVFKDINFYKQILIVNSFQDEYLNREVNFIVFSQHFSLSEGASFENEILYYKAIIEKAVGVDGKRTGLFKPHPRDTIEKIKAISELCFEGLRVIHENYQSVPIEFFVENFMNQDCQLFTGNSSAPLCFEGKLEIYSVFSKNYLPEKLNNEIVDFAKKYDLNLIEI